MSFLFDPFPVLRTQRLILREVTVEDVNEVLFLRSNKEVNTYIQRDTNIKNQDALSHIIRKAEGIKEGTNINWAISLINSNKMIGAICLWNFNFDNTAGELGYELHPEFQNQGIMSDAVKLVLAFGFEQLKLNQIEAFTHFKNEPSLKLLDKFGFKRNNLRKDEGNLNNAILELSKDRWIDKSNLKK